MHVHLQTTVPLSLLKHTFIIWVESTFVFFNLSNNNLNNVNKQLHHDVISAGLCSVQKSGYLGVRRCTRKFTSSILLRPPKKLFSLNVGIRIYTSNAQIGVMTLYIIKILFFLMNVYPWIISVNYTGLWYFLHIDLPNLYRYFDFA